MNNGNNQEALQIVSAFVTELMNERSDERVLHVGVSNFSIFNEVILHSAKVVSGFYWSEDIKRDEKYDFILGDFPLGMGNVDCYFEKGSIKVKRNWAELVKAVRLLSEDGLAVCVVEPSGFSSSQGKKLEMALNLEGYFVNGIINAPEGVLMPQTLLTPTLVLISKKKTNRMFISELLNKLQGIQVAKNYVNEAVSEELAQGMQIELGSFYSFDRIKVRQQIDKLESQYKEYDERAIREIANEINSVTRGNSFSEKDNSIYIPKIGKTHVVTCLRDTSLKHHNYFQVVLDTQASNEYLTEFFKSDLGTLVLQSLTSGSTIPRISKRDLEQATIALPSIDVQKEITLTHNKLEELREAINDFDRELALNPASSRAIVAQLDGMLKAIECLSEADEIRNVLRKGESKQVEFKETLSLDVKEKTKEKYLEEAVLKTIVAFMNSEGGELFIGVSDDGKISGLNHEVEKFYKGNVDKFQLHFKNLIKKRIGEKFYPFIDSKLVSVDRNDVFVVKCEKSKEPCFLDAKVFYVRTNPATDKLEGVKVHEYIKNHFK